MLTLERIWRIAAGLPGIIRLGLLGLALAGLADVVAHLEAGDVTDLGPGHAHTSSEFAAHLLGFVSMVVIQLRVVADGVRRSRTRKGVA